MKIDKNKLVIFSILSLILIFGFLFILQIIQLTNYLEFDKLCDEYNGSLLQIGKNKYECIYDDQPCKKFFNAYACNSYQ